MLVWGPPGTGKSKFVRTLVDTGPFAWLACNATKLFKSDRGATEQEIKRLFARARQVGFRV